MIAVITSGFPRRSETFMLNELLALDRAGVLGPVLATGPGDGAEPQPGTRRLAGRVRRLGPGPVAEQAAEAARRLRGHRVDAVHGYFAHRPAAVAEGAARALGVRFGFGVHARDARKAGRLALGSRARAAACVVACNADAAAEVGRAGAAATLVPHGVDLTRFAARPRSRRDGPLELLAVGRLVEKKGFEVLIEAVRGLEPAFRLRIVGEGEQRPRLERAIAAAGLERSVELTGARSHSQLPAAYARADLVVAPSVVDSGGDRDGLPNVVLEAMACGRAVIAGDAGAIATAIEHRACGLLVEPGNPVALREAIAELAGDPGLRQRLGRRARLRAEREFELDRCAERLRRVLEAAYG